MPASGCGGCGGRAAARGAADAGGGWDPGGTRLGRRGSAHVALCAAGARPVCARRCLGFSPGALIAAPGPEAGREGRREGRAGCGPQRRARVTLAAPGLRRASFARGPAERAPRQRGCPEAPRLGADSRRDSRVWVANGKARGGGAGGRGRCVEKALHGAQRPAPPGLQVSGGTRSRSEGARGWRSWSRGRCGDLALALRRAAAKRSAAELPPPSRAPGAAPAETGERGRKGSLGPEGPGWEDETAGRWPRGPGPDRVHGTTTRLESLGAGCK